jgi:hypothetical protein
MELELDENTNHLKECDALGGFDCNCTERVESAIINWTHRYIGHYSVPRAELEIIEPMFKLLEETRWR